MLSQSDCKKLKIISITFKHRLAKLINNEGKIARKYIKCNKTKFLKALSKRNYRATPSKTLLSIPQDSVEQLIVVKADASCLAEDVLTKTSVISLRL